MSNKTINNDHRLLWASSPWDYMSDEEWGETLKELAEINEWDYSEWTEQDKYDEMYEEIGMWLGDEIANLNIPTTGRIIAIADIGRWNGRVSGYKILKEENVNAIFQEMEWDQCEFYCDRHNVRMTNHHHDGTTYVLFRELKEDTNIEHFLDMIYEGKPIDSNTLSRYTRSLRPYIAKVYGW